MNWGGAIVVAPYLLIVFVGLVWVLIKDRLPRRSIAPESPRESADELLARVLAAYNSQTDDDDLAMSEVMYEVHEWVNREPHRSAGMSEQQECPRCYGTGYIPSETCTDCVDCQDKCPRCKGTGLVPKGASQ